MQPAAHDTRSDQTPASGAPADARGVEAEDVRAEARDYCELGIARYAQGDADDAAAYLQMSLDLCPTAPAHTALGVILAARGRWDDAIDQCREAIRLDPRLGNPRNDIGVYLIEQNRLDEALDMLDQAVAAPDYDCRHYAHYHRGRVLERRLRLFEARDAYRRSVDLDPTWPLSVTALRRVLGWLN